MIAPIQTTYNGVKYRSRTEARWAVFFNEAGIACDYEPEGYGLEAGWYLPDFYLPSIDLWFEVKPPETDFAERPRFEELCVQSGKRGIVAYGQPGTAPNLQFFDGEKWEGPFQLLEDRRDTAVYWLGSADPFRYFVIGGPGKQTDHDRLPGMSHRLASALKVASAERFGVHE